MPHTRLSTNDLNILLGAAVAFVVDNWEAFAKECEFDDDEASQLSKELYEHIGMKMLEHVRREERIREVMQMAKDMFPGMFGKN